jgi:hypothetical protein
MAQRMNITYVGKKAQREDSVAGTGLVWRQGETLPVPVAAAAVLLRYPDTWARADDDVTDDGEPEIEQAAPTRQRDVTDEALDAVPLQAVAVMDKADLARFAAEHNLVLDRRAGVDKQRAQIMAQLKTA